MQCSGATLNVYVNQGRVYVPTIPAADPISSEEPVAAGSCSIGDLAREFELTTRAIRFYEDCGLITPQRMGRNRVYSARDRARLKLTLRGKRLGLTLAEVKELLDMYESPRDTEAQLRQYLRVLGEHRMQLERQATDLQMTLDEVRAHESQAQHLLELAVRDPARGKC